MEIVKFPEIKICRYYGHYFISFVIGPIIGSTVLKLSKKITEKTIQDITDKIKKDHKKESCAIINICKIDCDCFEDKENGDSNG
jgi:hypothetical protein